MLDEQKYIARYDKHNALEVIASQPRQLNHDFDAVEIKGMSRVKQIVVAGMGGSALAAEFIKNWIGDRLPVPVIIVRDYALPGFVGEDTLVVISSYSGNTEEALSALEDARARKAKIVICTSGGQLAAEARVAGHPMFKLPGGYQPRLAYLYNVKAMATLIEKLGWLEGLTAELKQAAKWVSGEMGEWTGDVLTRHNDAKRIAEFIIGHPVVIYGGPSLMMPTMKWKINMNENAENIAFYNYLPEFNHNEFNGWSHPERSGIRVIELLSSFDRLQVLKRFEVSNRLLSKSFKPIQVQAQGKTHLQQMLWAILLGDFVSAYLGFLNGIDPIPVALIEELKKELA